MALFDKRLELITEDDLLSLIENQVREGYQTEFKQSVEFKDKQDKLDFLAGVTSFANSVGADLIIGVSATSGVPTAVEGWIGIDVDREKQRIENLLRDQVEPRVAFRIHEIRLQNGNTALLIRVPWSWAQPHMVRMDQVNRFYYRHSAEKDIMNVIQLRDAFALTSRLNKSRRFEASAPPPSNQAWPARCRRLLDQPSSFILFRSNPSARVSRSTLKVP